MPLLAIYAQSKEKFIKLLFVIQMYNNLQEKITKQILYKEEVTQKLMSVLGESSNSSERKS